MKALKRLKQSLRDITTTAQRQPVPPAWPYRNWTPVEHRAWQPAAPHTAPRSPSNTVLIVGSDEARRAIEALGVSRRDALALTGEVVGLVRRTDFGAVVERNGFRYAVPASVLAS